MSRIDIIALQAASEAFATERLPSNWETLSEEEQVDWLNEKKWAPLEHYDTDAFYSLIENHADSVKIAIKHALVELKEKLVIAAVNCDLPSDFNELDLEGFLNLE